MSKIRWHRFRDWIPEQGDAILISDHEGNKAFGIWDNRFVSACDFPIGIPFQWTPIFLALSLEDQRAVINEDHIYYSNGRKIDIDGMYDYTDPISKMNL